MTGATPPTSTGSSAASAFLARALRDGKLSPDAGAALTRAAKAAYPNCPRIQGLEDPKTMSLVFGAITGGQIPANSEF